MLTRTLLESILETKGDRLVPRYLVERDHPWLEVLLDERVRFQGHKLSELAAQRGGLLPIPAPRSKMRVAMAVLDALSPAKASSGPRPAEVRWRLFHAAAASSLSRDVIVEDVASSFEATPREIEAALFGDLRAERRIGALPEGLSPVALAARANAAIASSLVQRSSTIQITAFGDASTLVQRARRLGLICTVTPLGTALRRAAGDGLGEAFTLPNGALQLDISGPLALFHHTDVYGRALASLVPALSTCVDFELVARCQLKRGSHAYRFVLRPEDPVFDDTPTSAADSRFEERLTRAFERRAPEWALHWAPVALETSGTLLFADLELVSRRNERDRWLLVFPGFWTAAHLATLLHSLTTAGLHRVLLCVNDRQRAGQGDPPEHPQVVRFRTTLDPRVVLAKIQP